MGLLGSLRGGTRILGQLGWGPGPGKPLLDRPLPDCGLRPPSGAVREGPGQHTQGGNGHPGDC